MLALIVELLAAIGILRTTGVRFVSPAQRAGWETKGDSGLKGRDGWGRGVRPCGCPVADFQPAASATATNPALTSWAKECRAVGPGAARFDQSLGKLPFKSLSEQAFGAQGPLQSSLFLPTQNVEEPADFMKKDPQTYTVLGTAMEVHRELGPGFLEAMLFQQPELRKSG